MILSALSDVAQGAGALLVFAACIWLASRILDAHQERRRRAEYRALRDYQWGQVIEGPWRGRKGAA